MALTFGGDFMYLSATRLQVWEIALHVFGLAREAVCVVAFGVSCVFSAIACMLSL